MTRTKSFLFWWPLLLFWALLAALPVGPKTASGQNLPQNTASTDFATQKPAPPLGFERLTQKRTAGACVVAKGGTGRLIGSTENLTIAEKGFINEMVAGGRTVEIIPTGASRTADFLIDGVRHELKTLSGVVNQTSDGLSSALSNRIMNGRGQSGNIIVDARTQPGMTAEIAERGIIRAFGKDNITGAKIQNITVITPEGTVSIPRKP